MNKKSYHLQYVNAGKELFALKDGTKRPNGLWTKCAPIVAGSCSNAGWRLGERDVVIDVDAYKEGALEAWQRLQVEYGLPEPTVKTPKGGYHTYLRVPEGVRIKNDNAGKWCGCNGIDVKAIGGYVVVAGSETVASEAENTVDGVYDWYDLFGSFEQHDCPAGLLEILPKAAIRVSINSDVGAGNSDGMGDNDDLDTWLDAGDFETTQQEAERYLAMLDPDVINDDWIKYGMALSRCRLFDGYAVWEAWSAKGDKYKAGDCQKRWRSFKNDRPNQHLVTMGSLIKDAKRNEKVQVMNKVDGYVAQFETVADRLALDDLCDTIKKNEKFSDDDFAILVKCVQAAFKRITNARMDVATARNKIRKSGVTTSVTVINDIDKPSWCSEWVYIANNNQFFNKQNNIRYSPSAFNQKLGSEIPASEKGGKISATKYVADWGLLQIVDQSQYMPCVDDLIFSMGGVEYVNTFNKRSLPVAAEDYTDEGLLAIDKIKKHIKTIFVDDEQSDIMLQWLAWQRQRIGEKILWCPLIQGVEGIGKSFFGELLRVLIGQKNVGEVSPREAISSFNGWATNVAVNVLSELRIAGHNRYEALNALKPLITDKNIQINEKGVPQYQAVNVTNYICTTNYKDAIPLDGNDRRWWVTFANFNNIEEFCKHVGCSDAEYFTALFDSIRLYSDEVVKFFDEYEITPQFAAMKRAPDTLDKQMMIATEQMNVEGLDEAKELLEMGGQYYNKDWLSSSHFFDQLSLQCDDYVFTNQTKSQILKKLGFLKYKNMKIDKKTYAIWTSKKMSHEYLKKEIDFAPPF